MHADHQGFAEDWIASWNAHDLTRILSHYDDGVVLTSPRAKMFLGLDDGTVRGKDALRDYFATGLERAPDLAFTLERVYSGIGSMVVEFTTKDCRHGAEFMDFDSHGRVARVVAHYANDRT